MIRQLSLAEFARGLASNGRRNVRGASATFWARYDRIAMMRMPYFYLGTPAPGEVRRVLWQGPAALASYLVEPDDQHLANAWLYICTDRAYGLEKLSPAMRRNVRRGLQELRIEPIKAEQLMAHGTETFRDTLRRNGLRDWTPDKFRRQVALRSKFPGHVFLGAWKDKQLAAYLSVLEVEDWVEITSSFSADNLLHLRPNDALLFSALHDYLVEQGRRIVSFGSSSIQTESNRAGLHAFKTKVGFEAQPVHRAFVLHPLMRPFANRLTLRGVNTALHLIPGNLRLKRTGGVLGYILGENHMPER